MRQISERRILNAENDTDSLQVLYGAHSAPGQSRLKAASLEEIGCIVRKLREAAFPGRGGVTICAERFGVSPQYWRDWETGKRKPGARNRQKLAEFFRIPLIALTGDAAPHRPAGAVLAPTAPVPGIPVLGLASCGVSGWYFADPVAVRAVFPTHEKMFCVIAKGHSMIPDGIADGFLLYCDPTLEPRKNDAVFVKTADGKATIKRFLKWEEGWLHLLGWLDPDWQNFQKPFVSKLPRDFIDMICPVVLVQRR